jgi:ketosteroid isomerase-like protein
MRPRTLAALQKMRGILRLPILVPPVPARDDRPAGEFGAYIILVLLSSDRTAYALLMLRKDEMETTDAAGAVALVPERDWWERLFATVDSGDASGFVQFLTPDAQFRFGNAPVIVGETAIGVAVAGFFAAITSSRHRLLRTWNGAASAACEGEVTYTRHDGSVVSFPFANAFEFRGQKIAAYRIYIDNSSLFAPSAQP